MANTPPQKPKKQRKGIRVYCIECFSIFNWSPRTTRSRCPNCYAITTLNDLHKSLNFAEEAVRLGYLYPKVLRRDRTKGIRKAYSLATSEILIWLGLAVLGGVVGNLSYDLVKTAVKKILGRKRRVSVSSAEQVDRSRRVITLGYKQITTIRLSDQEITQLIRSVRKYVVKSQDRRHRQGERRRLIDAIVSLMERDAEGRKLLKARGGEIKKTLERQFRKREVVATLPGRIARRIGRKIHRK